MDSIYFFISTSPYEEAKIKLADLPKEQLERLVLNEHYNDFLRQYADYKGKESPVDPTVTSGWDDGKRIPYIGWFWRSVDFARGRIYIGDCGNFIGFMENNKWDYPERTLDPDEFKKVMEVIDRAIKASRQGGMLNEIERETKKILEELFPLFQTFSI